jgi:exodeoxyribonuclease III
MSSSTLSIATWNVNSIKARHEHVLTWLQEAQPDFAALQETKTVDSAFPVESFANLGYECVFFGQKTYNGVAVLTKRKVDSFETGATKFAHLEVSEKTYVPTIS